LFKFSFLHAPGGSGARNEWHVRDEVLLPGTRSGRRGKTSSRCDPGCEELCCDSQGKRSHDERRERCAPTQCNAQEPQTRNAARPRRASAGKRPLPAVGFGGGEATRDHAPTVYDPQGKQQAIHKAESFAEYLAKRSEAGGGGAAAAGEATRDSAPWPADPPPPPAAPPAYAPPAAAAPTAEGGSAYDPWKDPALIEVTFMVDGVPKKYRIAQ